MSDADNSSVSGDEVPISKDPKDPKANKGCKDAKDAKASEKEERLKERERKKEQALLDKALEQSRKDAKRTSSSSSSGKGEKEKQQSSSSSKSDISNLSHILIDGFKSLRHEFGGLKSSLTDGFSSINENLEYGFESIYYGDAEGDGLGCTSDAGNTRENDTCDPDVSATDPDADGAASPLAEDQTGRQEIVSLFTKLANEIIVATETGESVSPDLAKLVNEHCIHPISLEGFIQMKKGYRRPQNCDQLQVPTIPEVIWSRLDGTSRGRDKAWQSVQDDFLAVITAIVQALQRLDDLQVAWSTLVASAEGSIPGGVLDALNSHGGALNKIILTLVDAVKMGGYLHRSGLTEKRREAMKPKLPGDFKRLVGSTFAPSAVSLFGNIVDNVKTISETSKLSNQMDAASKRPSSSDRGVFRYTPYNNRGRGRGTGGFLANRRARGRFRGSRGNGRGFHGQSNFGSPNPSGGRQESSQSNNQGFQGRGAPAKQW